MKEKQTNDSVHIYLQEGLTGDAFIREMEKWFTEVEDERMRLLGKLLFEIELSEEEIFHDTLYAYGSLLTEKNYLGRKIFEELVVFMSKMVQMKSEYGKVYLCALRCGNRRRRSNDNGAGWQNILQ